MAYLVMGSENIFLSYSVSSELGMQSFLLGGAQDSTREKWSHSLGLRC